MSFLTDTILGGRVLQHTEKMHSLKKPWRWNTQQPTTEVISTVALSLLWHWKHYPELTPGLPERSLSPWPHHPHKLQDSSYPKTPQALYLKHQTSHLACSHTPSKGHLHPHNYDSGPHRTEYLMSHSQAVWKQPSSLGAALCWEHSPALIPSALSKRKAAWRPEQDINSCWIHKYSNIISFQCKARVFVIKESNPNLFWWSGFGWLVLNFTGITKVIWCYKLLFLIFSHKLKS